MSAIDYKIDGMGSEPARLAEPVGSQDVEHLRPLPRISIHAFCESESVLRTLERCGQDRRMGKVNLRSTAARSLLPPICLRPRRRRT